MSWKTFRIEDMETVRAIFGDPIDADFTLNWCFCSTSGVHGSYCTIDDEESYFADPERFVREENCGEEHTPTMTITVVKPRVVQIGSGSPEVTPEDLVYLRELVRRTLDGVLESQEGNRS